MVRTAPVKEVTMCQQKRMTKRRKSQSNYLQMFTSRYIASTSMRVLDRCLPVSLLLTHNDFYCHSHVPDSKFGWTETDKHGPDNQSVTRI